jgi:hypothetical protein
MAEGIGDIAGLDFVPAIVEGVEVVVDGGVAKGGSISNMRADVHRDASQSLGGTHVGVTSGAVSYFFAADSILLVREFEGSERDSFQVVLVMQRCVGGVVDTAVNREEDVTESEGLAAGRSVGRACILGGAHEPVEGNDTQELCVAVEDAPLGMVRVKGFEESADDGDVDRVGPGGGVIFALEALDEIKE